MESNQKEIIERLSRKTALKYQVYDNTYQTFLEIKKAFAQMSSEIKLSVSPGEIHFPVEYRERNEFEVEMLAANDLLVAMMHTDVFEFPRAHIVQQMPYTREDPTRSYCGIISIYNFLSDSLKYNRINDLGYLVGRIFINKENHFFVEGKRQLSFLYNDFTNHVINPTYVREILNTTLSYSIDFDLLVPPFDVIKEVSVQEINFIASSQSLKTGKRLGFKFEADNA